MVKWFIELIRDALIIVFGALSLHIFIRLFQYGEVILLERVSWILYTEIVLAALIILFGIERAIGDWRKR